ncbi:MAG: LysR family transcriptional regulator [Polyangiaceae bacterium]
MERSPLAGVDVNLLVALDAMLTEEHVGRAAKKIGLSASAMSHALSRLQLVLGDPILVRAGQRMQATARAREMAGPLREGLSLVERAVARPAPFDPKNEKGTLRIAAIDFVQNQLLPPLLAMLRRDAPGVCVGVASLEPRVMKDLVAGELDLVVTLDRESPGLKKRVLAQAAFVCMVREGHPALARPITPAVFASLPHALISSRKASPGAVDRALAKVGLSRRVVLAVPSFTAAALAVAQTDMVLTGALHEAERVARSMGLALFPPPLPVEPFRLAMYWHERLEHDPFLLWAREQIAAVVAALPSPGKRAPG